MVLTHFLRTMSLEEEKNQVTHTHIHTKSLYALRGATLPSHAPARSCRPNGTKCSREPFGLCQNFSPSSQRQRCLTVQHVISAELKLSEKPHLMAQSKRSGRAIACSPAALRSSSTPRSTQSTSRVRGFRLLIQAKHRRDHMQCKST